MEIHGLLMPTHAGMGMDRVHWFMGFVITGLDGGVYHMEHSYLPYMLSICKWKECSQSRHRIFRISGVTFEQHSGMEIHSH